MHGGKAGRSLVSKPLRWVLERDQAKRLKKTMAASVPPDGPPITKVRTSRLHATCIFVETDNRIHRPAYIYLLRWSLPCT